MPSGADLEYARMLARAGKVSGAGLDGARLEQLQGSRYEGSRKLRPITENTHILPRGSSPNNLSDGVSTGITTHLSHIARVSFAGLRLVYSNVYNNNGVDTPGTNDISIKANIRFAGGLNVPVYFNGKRTIVLEPGAVIVSDVIGLSLSKGEQFYTRTYVSVTAGGKYPLGITTNINNGEGVASGDLVDGAVTPNSARSYSPWAIIGTPSENTDSPVIVTIGDSITSGAGDVSGAVIDFGWVRRAFDSKFSYINLGIASSNAANSDHVSKLASRMRITDTVSPDVAFVLYGTNDLAAGATLSQMQSYITSLVNILLARGLDVYVGTVPPYTTSTDGWATLNNQTPHANTPIRIAYNTWLRNNYLSIGCAGLYEFADAVETSRGSGLWKVGFTQDGVHPSGTGHAAMAALINPEHIGTTL